MFRSKKINTYISLNESFKDWKDATHEVEAMGARLDAARETLKHCKEGTWAHTHWSQVEATVLRKWQMMVSLQSSGLRQTGPDRSVPIDYSWFEKSDEVAMRLPVLDGITSWLTDKVSSPNLERAWAMAMEQKLQKARQGLA